MKNRVSEAKGLVLLYLCKGISIALLINICIVLRMVNGTCSTMYEMIIWPDGISDFQDAIY